MVSGDCQLHSGDKRLFRGNLNQLASCTGGTRSLHGWGNSPLGKVGRTVSDRIERAVLYARDGTATESGCTCITPEQWTLGRAVGRESRFGRLGRWLSEKEAIFGRPICSIPARATPSLAESQSSTDHGRHSSLRAVYGPNRLTCSTEAAPTALSTDVSIVPITPAAE